MVKAGEAGGALEVILQRLADFLEKGSEPQGQDHRRHGLPGRRDLRRRRHPDVHHGRHHSEVQEDLRRIRPHAPLGHADAHQNQRLDVGVLVDDSPLPGVGLHTDQTDTTIEGG